MIFRYNLDILLKIYRILEAFEVGWHQWPKTHSTLTLILESQGQSTLHKGKTGGQHGTCAAWDDHSLEIFIESTLNRTWNDPTVSHKFWWFTIADSFQKKTSNIMLSFHSSQLASNVMFNLLWGKQLCNSYPDCRCSMASPDRYCCIHLQPRRLRRTSRFSGAMRFLVEGIFDDQVDQQGVPGISGAGMFFQHFISTLTCI